MSAATTAVAATGTDPDRLDRVIAWLLRPRRSGDGLRRACGQVPDGEPGERLDEVLPPVSRADRTAVAEIGETWRRAGVRAALVGDPAYPARLAAGWPATTGPPLLAWTGSVPWGGPAVAVVGARRASGYGTGVAAWVAATVARAGVHVVSGGARGIDAAAHRAALEEPGGTSVVLGCGHAVAYPRVHAAPGGLFDDILAHGGTLLSEQLPHASPHAGNVRARNRVVAGLVEAVVVVEGSERSGALVTAGAAADLGVPVLAVPGDVRAPGSVAPHQLLAEGAEPCRGPEDVLAVLGEQGREPRAPGAPGATEATPVGLPADLGRMLAEAWPRPLRIEELAERTGRPVPALLGALTQARVAGVVAQGVDGVRLRRAP
jgi:DNA processing protein